MKNFVLVSMGFVFFLALGCTPRSYEVKTTTTATTVVEKKTEMLVSWNEINQCDYVIDKSERLACFDRLIVSLRLAKRVDSERVLEYEVLEKLVQERICGLAAELGRDSPEYCPKPEAPAPIVMDVSFCEFCSHVEHLVRGAEHPEAYPSGWQLKIPKGRLIVQLEINGVVVAEMVEPFSSYVIEVVEGPPDANGKKELVNVDVRRVGEYKACSAELANPD